MAGKQTSLEEAQVRKAWAKVLSGDPVSWLLSSDEPAARWITLTAVFYRAPTDPGVLEARGRVVADAQRPEAQSPRVRRIAVLRPCRWSEKATSPLATALLLALLRSTSARRSRPSSSRH
jgi:hypothetical protein